jgi:tRNA (cmo5U34)-methyltransferase
MTKATIEEIRERFDNDVERFSNLETGQVSTVDAALSLQLITESAKRLCPQAADLLDIGCGAGNYTLRMLGEIPDLNCTLIDLSLPMLNRAKERISPKTQGSIETIQSDIRNANLSENRYDIILAGAVLHHLRDNADWESVFAKLFSALKPGGCLLVSDLITQESEALADYFTERYTDYLTGVNGAAYADNVLAYIAKEDTPRSLNYQLDLMRKAGFRQVDILHKNICFAAYCGIK